MENIPEILSNLQAKKTENNDVLSALNNISPEHVKALDEKINWHSKVINYAIYAVIFWLVMLTWLGVVGYFRLDDRINNENHFFTQRLDEEQRFSAQRFDAYINTQTEKPRPSVNFPIQK